MLTSSRRLSLVRNESHSLCSNQAINPTKENFGRPVSSEFSTERTANHGVVFGESFNASGNVTSTPLATHNPSRRKRASLLGEVHAHGLEVYAGAFESAKASSCGSSQQHNGLYLGGA